MAHDNQVKNEIEESTPRRQLKTLSDTVADWLMLYAQTYREEITEELAVLYQEALKDIRPEILHKAFLRAAKSLKFRPTPAEVREAAEVEFELAAAEKQERSGCGMCQWTGWRIVPRTDGLPGEWAIACDCRKAKSA